MPPLTGTVTGNFGASAQGSVTFSPSVPSIVDMGGNVISLPSLVEARLVNGAFSTTLTATNDPAYTPINWTYTVRVNVVNLPFSGFSMFVPSGIATDLADVIPTTPATPVPSAAFRFLQPTGVAATDTSNIQTAMDEVAALGGGIVLLAPGIFAVTQIVVPAKVWLQGSGWHGFGTNFTMLKHLTAQAVDMIRFKANASGFAGPCGVTDLQLGGHPSSSAGCGINTLDAGGATVVMQDATTLARIYVRGFAGDGVLIRGGSPLILTDIATLFNGGYGVRVIDTGGGDPFGRVHHVNMRGISGDGNNGGAALRFEGIQNMGGITLMGVKSERRDNTDRGGSNQQPNAIQLDNCAAPVSVNGITHISSGLSTTKPGDVIVVSGAAQPEITWAGAGVRVLASQTVGADPLMLTDGTTTFARSATCGHYRETSLLRLNFGNSTLPAASSSLRGQIRFVQGAGGVADELYVCRKNAADAYEWRLLT